ncbi:MAG: tetratricopeptide repeat protein [Pseudomonadota bacterium]
MKRALFIPLLLLGTSVLAADDSWIQQSYHKSFHYEQTENYKTAIKSLLPVVRAYPKGYTVNLRLGWLYYLMGRYANSIAHYEVAIKTAPNAIEAKVGKLLPLLAQERYSKAEQTTYQILNTDFYNYLGNLRLSIALRKQNKTDLALEVVNKMLFLYPTDVNFMVELGQLYDQKGEKEKAAAVFQDVIVLAPENVTAKSYLGK